MSTIHVSDRAARWYKEELNLNEGDSIRFFARYSSGGGLHPGFHWESLLRNRVTRLNKPKFRGFAFYGRSRLLVPEGLQAACRCSGRRTRYRISLY